MLFRADKLAKKLQADQHYAARALHEALHRWRFMAHARQLLSRVFEAAEARWDEVDVCPNHRCSARLDGYLEISRML